MQTTRKPENRNWPRENAKKTTKEKLFRIAEERSGFSLLKSLLRSALYALCVLLRQNALADVRYVDVNSTNAAPSYISWATAATNIQDAVDAAVAGDEIVVTSGIYATGKRVGSRVVVDKPLNLRSVYGPQFTFIDGGQSNRCVYLTNGASLSGFTLRNGTGRAGGGGGAYGGTLNNCVLSQNTVRVISPLGQPLGYGGGAAYSTLNNCTLTGNWVSASDVRSHGGGAYSCTLNNCTLTENSADYGGGAYYSTLNNCIVYLNRAVGGANYDSSSILNYSCTTPLPASGVGNLTNDPALVNLAAGNYRLRPDSPCIDSGTNLGASITNDLDGRPRPLDGNGDGLAAFDMGAYEYRTPLLVWQDSPNPAPPHADWTTAAHTIQDAVDAAVGGDEIVVTNGIYATGGRAVDGFTTNRVAVDKPLTLRSVSGPQFTLIRGFQVPGSTNGDGAVRCVYLTNGSSLSGFTLTNGATRSTGDHSSEKSGGGVLCASLTAVVSNCTLTANSAYLFGGGAVGGTLINCTLSRNSAGYGGGGARAATLNHCTLTGNSATNSGGGASGATLNNCTLSGNSTGLVGGGAFYSTLNNCTLTGNSAAYDGGGAFSGTLNTCTLTGNSAGFNGGGASGATLNNCTLSGNSARAGGGASVCTLNNCIVYFNTAPQGANYFSQTLNYSCTTPLPTNGVGNITNAPMFLDPASGNLRLQSNSPCINAGNNSQVTNATDLDGNPRVVGGSVDMGAYEFQLPPQLTITSSGTNIIFAWPTNYAEVVIQGDHYEAYFLYSTTNLVSPVAWTIVYPMPVASDGQLVVTHAIDGTQRFYRIVKETGPLGDVPCLPRGPKPGTCFGCFHSPIPGIWVWAQYANCRL